MKVFANLIPCVNIIKDNYMNFIMFYTRKKENEEKYNLRLFFKIYVIGKYVSYGKSFYELTK